MIRVGKAIIAQVKQADKCATELIGANLSEELFQICVTE